MEAPLEVKVNAADLRLIGARLRTEAGGKELRKDLIKELRLAVEPGVSAVQGKLRSIPHNTAAEPSPAMGSYLASKVRTQVRLSGASAGVAVRIPQTPELRGFAKAARYLNRASWRHRVYGRNTWVTQQSPIPGYFDDTLAEGKPRYRTAVYDALRRMTRRLAGKL